MSVQWHISRLSMSEAHRHKSYGVGPEELRRRREAQLEGLRDAEFAAEVRLHQESALRQPSLRAHARKPWGDFEELLGHGLVPSDLDALSRLVLDS